MRSTVNVRVADAVVRPDACVESMRCAMHARVLERDSLIFARVHVTQSGLFAKAPPPRHLAHPRRPRPPLLLRKRRSPAASARSRALHPRPRPLRLQRHRPRRKRSRAASRRLRPPLSLLLLPPPPPRRRRRRRRPRRPLPNGRRRGANESPLLSAKRCSREATPAWLCVVRVVCRVWVCVALLARPTRAAECRARVRRRCRLTEYLCCWYACARACGRCVRGSSPKKNWYMCM